MRRGCCCAAFSSENPDGLIRVSPRSALIRCSRTSLIYLGHIWNISLLTAFVRFIMEHDMPPFGADFLQPTRVAETTAVQ